MYNLILREMQRFLRRGRSVARLALGKGLSADLFDLYYVVKKDPWNYRTSELEQRKYRPLGLSIGCSKSAAPKANLRACWHLGSAPCWPWTVLPQHWAEPANSTCPRSNSAK